MNLKTNLFSYVENEKLQMAGKLDSDNLYRLPRMWCLTFLISLIYLNPVVRLEMKAAQVMRLTRRLFRPMMRFSGKALNLKFI